MVSGTENGSVKSSLMSVVWASKEEGSLSFEAFYSGIKSYSRHCPITIQNSINIRVIVDYRWLVDKRMVITNCIHSRGGQTWERIQSSDTYETKRKEN